MSLDKESTLSISGPPPPYPSDPFVYPPPNYVELSQVNDYLPWSIVNLLCGWGILGIIPLVFSIVCRNDKSLNNFKQAQTMSKMALVFNVFITIVGVFGWVIFIIVVTNYLISLKYLT